MFTTLSNHLTNIIKNLTGRGRLTTENIQETLEAIKLSLLEADVPLVVVTTFLENVQTTALGQKVIANIRPGDALVKIVYDELVTILGTTQQPLNIHTKPPTIILVVGLQGSGKTTTVAKLAHWLHTTKKKSVLLTSIDIYRPAALEQLQVLAGQINIECFASHLHAQPLTIVQEAITQARQRLNDIIIIDTAGRLHIDTEMMQEITTISQTICPQETLLVVDSMMGQDAVNTAKAFTTAVPLTGIILTKTDGDARGGAALAMRMLTQQPIKFMGTGEKIDSLEPFYPERIASRILGMGDILTLVEEAYHKVDQQQAQKLAKKFKKGTLFDLDDFRAYLHQMSNMGGIHNMLSKLPGTANTSRIGNHIDEKLFTKMEVIINSMTPRERHFPAFIKGSHKQRIAKGSGTQVQDINRLLKQFAQIQKMMVRFKGAKIQNLLKYF